MRNKRTLGITIAILVVIGVVVGGIYLYPNYFSPSNIINQNKEAASDVVATVDGENIYLKDYKERLFATTGSGTPEDPGSLDEHFKEPVLNDLVNLKIIDKELAKRNITVTDAELATAAKSTFVNYDSSESNIQKIYRNFVRLKVGRNKLQSSMLTWREGYVLFCRFDRAYALDMKDKEQKADNLIAKQKSYAGEYCQKAKSRLASGQTDFDKELKSLKADKVIGSSAWKPYTVAFGNKFDREFFSQGREGEDLDFLSQLDKLDYKSGAGFYILDIKEDLSKRQGAIVKLGVRQGTRDVMKALVYLNGKGNDGETISFDKWIAGKALEYDIKKYPERIKI